MDKPQRGAQVAGLTPHQLRQRLIAAFRALPDIGIYSPGAGALVPLEPGADFSHLDLIAITAKYLAREDRLMLLAWARAKAARRSTREVCRELGWSKSRFYRRVDHAARAVADGIQAREAIARALGRHFQLVVPPRGEALDAFIADIKEAVLVAA